MASAYGFIETRGFIGAAEATDALSKAANVEFVHREDIGSMLVTTACKGDVGAVRSAISSGEQAAREVGEFHAAHVIPNLNGQVIDRVLGGGKCESIDDSKRSLGLVECMGYSLMIEAADAGVKAAGVDIVNYALVGGGRVAVTFRGDVAACRAAVDAGQAGAERLGTVTSAHVIPAPHQSLFETYVFGPKLKGAKAEKADGTALGFIEVKGYVSLVEATDAAVKAARVVPLSWQKIGSGQVTIVVQGEVAACRSAVDAAAAAAERVGEHVVSHVIARPHDFTGSFVAANGQGGGK